ncbi:MAG: sodium-extruding oxaloacetate decarboxylase subunit alpha [Euryarchaeota archaeon]|nr:sodium-extruding oxaloacetate decarboxylase subunit alpha [Euryarchaeota archaeon]
MTQVAITDTTLRDAHQSLIATRMRTRDMLPIAEKLDSVGFFSLEVWGGATFDVCIRFLNEDPWDRLRSLADEIRKTPLQMLLRGQNLVGYRHYPDDIVIKFVEKSAENGIEIFRVFDAVNDIRNMEVAITAAKKTGAHVQGAISYTISPVHTIETFVANARELAALDCDSICIKDMAGLISPHAAYDLIKTLKDEIGLPVDLHSHSTSGMASMSYMAACRAGVDILDTAFSPFAGGTSQPPTETVVAGLDGTPYDTGLDIALLTDIKEYFDGVKEKYRGILDPVSEKIDTSVLIHQIPGGMLSNLVSQLKEQNAMDRYDDVLQEMPKVREDLGYPPLVTPTSQIVGTQAVLNVLMGERYKVIPKEVRDYVSGIYGRPPAPINKQLLAKVLGDDVAVTCRPADLLPPELEMRTKEAQELGIVRKEEDILTYAIYPQIAPKFLKGEAEEERLQMAAKAVSSGGSGVPVHAGLFNKFKVVVDGETFVVEVEPTGTGEMDAATGAGDAKQAPASAEGGIASNMHGMVLGLKVSKGDVVEEGDVVAVIEAMKMENNIHSPHSGIVKEIFVSEGDTVGTGDNLMSVY